MSTSTFYFPTLVNLRARSWPCTQTSSGSASSSTLPHVRRLIAAPYPRQHCSPIGFSQCLPTQYSRRTSPNHQFHSGAPWMMIVCRLNLRNWYRHMHRPMGISLPRNTAPKSRFAPMSPRTEITPNHSEVADIVGLRFKSKLQH
jgi:hypothetical protein